MTHRTQPEYTRLLTKALKEKIKWKSEKLTEKIFAVKTGTNWDPNIPNKRPDSNAEIVNPIVSNISLTKIRCGSIPKSIYTASSFFRRLSKKLFT